MSNETGKGDAAPDLLVFLANETLAPEERRIQEQRAEASAQYRAELEALKAIRREMQAADMGTSPGELGLVRLMRDVAKEPVKDRSPNLWRLGAIAAMLLLAMQLALPGMRTGPDVELADGGVEAPLSGPTLKVTFAATATEQDLRSLLLELELTIVSGPSALGVYTLAAPDAEAAKQAVARLEVSPEVIDSVEAIGAE